MNFLEIARARYSCRHYDPTRPVEEDKLAAVLETARLAPSACNGQPYRITVCRGEQNKAIAKATQSVGLNGFVDDAPVLLVISEQPYTTMAATGAKVCGNDYRSMDIGILAAYITAEAAAQGLGSCMVGWLKEEKIRRLCGVDGAVRLVITLGYATPKPVKEGETPATTPKPKKRKSMDELVGYIGE